MKPHELSKKLNPLGKVMNLPEAFNHLKKEDHSSSFENLGEWLDHNHSKPEKMKMIYKIAASFVFISLIFVACSIPVQHEEEIGYMIKGTTVAQTDSTERFKFNFRFSYDFSKVGIDPEQVSINPILHERVGEAPQNLHEVVMLLPEANRKRAEEKKNDLARIIDFRSVEILPIEDTVQRTLFESALHKFDIQKEKEIVVEKRITERINAFMHSNSEITNGNVKLRTDKNGNRIAEIEVRTINDVNQNVEIEFEPNGTRNFRVKEESAEIEASPEEID